MQNHYNTIPKIQKLNTEPYWPSPKVFTTRQLFAAARIIKRIGHQEQAKRYKSAAFKRLFKRGK